MVARASDAAENVSLKDFLMIFMTVKEQRIKYQKLIHLGRRMTTEKDMKKMFTLYFKSHEKKKGKQCSKFFSRSKPF